MEKGDCTERKECGGRAAARFKPWTMRVKGAVSGLVSAGGSTLKQRIRSSQRARMASSERAGIRCIWVLIINIGTSSVLVAVRS